MRFSRKIHFLWTILFSVVGRGWGQEAADFARFEGEPGQRGGKLVVAQRAEPKTLNPVAPVDRPSRDVIQRMTADLIHINRYTQKTEPALCKSWKASPDGKSFTLKLRRGVRFSDGVPMDADDVVFSFRVYLDENVHSPQRDLLLISGKPISVEKLDAYTVRFLFPSPYAAAERVFDGFAILPRHLLEKDYAEGKIMQDWSLATSPEKIAGLGPFRLKQFVAGDRIVLERNPYYWRVDTKGERLPYLNELIFLTVPNQDAEVVRFQAGDTQAISGLSAENFANLAKMQQSNGYKLLDAGPGLEYNFLLFNLNDDTEGRYPEIARRQHWFEDLSFRQAVSFAIDRAAMVRLVFGGRGAPLASQVTPGNKLWVDSALQAPVQSIEEAKNLLRKSGFSWKQDGGLIDRQGGPVEFTILVNSSNAQRAQMAALIQDDLKKIGMNVQIVSLEFRSWLDRITKSHEYETALMGLGSPDVDPTPGMNVWVSSGQTHLWHLGEKKPATPWEAEIDRLMDKQLITVNYRERKKLYDRVQEIIAEQKPMIFLASPNILTGAQSALRNFRPAIIDNYILWNADELYWPDHGRTP
ncbi:MAG TPA: ABC transporter substrate-binding protein [Candidatus Angelobacter sp.]|nr:ABC transporter substrate-binding protein [Candidatus Angelobacter sp.]